MIKAVVAFLVTLLLVACSSQAKAPPAPAKRTGYAQAGALRMYYEVHGAGPPIVLLHGGITTIETSFGKVLPELARTRQVIAVEQQGHGRTADIDRPLTFEQEADDTAAVLRQLGVKQADVLGYSDGGNVALGLAIRHPELVRRVVIAGANTSNDGLAPGMLEFMQKAAAKPPEEAAADMPPELKAAYEQVAPRPQDWPRLISKVMQQAVALKGWTPEQLKGIKAETLVIAGDRDIITVEHAAETARLIPNAQLAVFPGADHMVLMERTDLLFPVLRPFLAEPPAATPRR